MSRIMSKQDCAHARTAQDIERKYSINKRFSKTEKTISDTQTEVNSGVASLQTDIDNLKLAQERSAEKINTHTKEIADLTEAVENHDIQLTNLTDAVETHNQEIADLTETEGDVDGWHYIKWNSGLVMCWKTFSKTLTSADWITWGALYCAPLISGESLPFAISSNKREFATLHSTADVMLISNECTITTGTYKVCSPISYTEDCTIQIDVMVVGTI